MPSTAFQKTCIIIAGPTAVGKTDVSITLARHFNTAIISADSRQCYRELDIGVAKPSALQLEAVKHYFIHSHTIAEEVNAGSFEQYALQAAAEIFLEKDIAIMVGGTGLYIRSFCEGMDEIPAISPELRNDISMHYHRQGLAWLQQELQVQDPEWYAVGEIQNPQRMMRALEVVKATGRSILAFRGKKKQERPFRIIKIGLNLPRERLYGQIDLRVNAMIKDGLEEEARSLLPCRQLNALQTVGYREMFEYLEGKTDLKKAIEDIKKNTRHYAKRQLTWFTKDQVIQWFEPGNDNQILDYLHHLL